MKATLCRQDLPRVSGHTVQVLQLQERISTFHQGVTKTRVALLVKEWSEGVRLPVNVLMIQEAVCAVLGAGRPLAQEDIRALPHLQVVDNVAVALSPHSLELS